MPIRFNPITGLLDQIEGPEFPDVTGAVPETQEDGFFAVAEVSGQGRIYWIAEGKRYHAVGTLEN